MKYFRCPNCTETMPLDDIDLGKQKSFPVINRGDTIGGCPNCDHFGVMNIVRA